MGQSILTVMAILPELPELGTAPRKARGVALLGALMAAGGLVGVADAHLSNTAHFSNEVHQVLFGIGSVGTVLAIAGVLAMALGRTENEKAQ
jgi:hypothetical protein